jgi:hypothetical protein
VGSVVIVKVFALPVAILFGFSKPVSTTQQVKKYSESKLFEEVVKLKVENYLELYFLSLPV